MPTYVYACTECGHQFEAHQAFSDASLTECPNCSGKLRKVFNSVGIVFKGSGFYRTDSREKPASGGTEKSESGAKPAEKTAAKADSTAGAASGSSSSSGSSGSSSSSGSASSSGSSGASGSGSAA